MTVVAVVGSARLIAPDPRWQQAFELGAGIAARGWTLLTGGYGGLMGAASEGAGRAGAAVIGLPMRGWTELTPTPFATELRWCGSYAERVAELMRADVVVAAAGGIGTLAEITGAWAALQTEPRAPGLVLLGEPWRRLLAEIGEALVVGQEDLDLPLLADTVPAALDAIQLALTACERRAVPRG
ncbi:LOG family protein [Mycobacterium sp. 3519A]|uniref:LOG family protein n=1 Tax=Mycobacterium sp. 3519A TaxID=2057184 RepID=UPI000C7CC7E6|nr:LOG family protein [Mycobacterium sp. 3519A]